MLNLRSKDHTDVHFRPNSIYCGDCKEVLKHFPENCVDLIYLDPPFFSNQQYEVIWGDGYEIRAFEDRWKGGIQNYIGWMEERLVECQRVLKETGTVYLHCDSHASHYLKVMMDKLFTESNFVNEIVWERSHSRSSISRIFRRAHDTLLLYSKTKKYNFNIQTKKLSEGSMKLYSNEDAKGTYQLVPVLVSGVRHGETGKKWRGIDPNKLGQNGMHWVTLPTNLEQYEKDGLLYWPKKTGGLPRLKYYLKQNKGVPMTDVWRDVGIIEAGSGESLGYPTQKPIALLTRIIEASSNPTDIVLDPFCGCGTAIAAAHNLGRRWIGIDVSPTACKLMQKRMRLIYAQGVEVIGLPQTAEQLKKLQPFEFQNWVMDKLYARVNPRKTGDMGIDGYSMEGSPIQVKQSDDVGRNVIDNFETAIKRADRKKGFIIAFSFGKGAHEEVARIKNKEGVEIILRTVEELLQES